MKKKWFPKAWIAVFVTILWIVFSVFFLNQLFRSISIELDDCQKIEGNITSIETRFIETKEHSVRFGTQIKKEERLIITIDSYQHPIQLNKETYAHFFNKIISEAKMNKNAIIYLRKTGDINLNPYQIEINGKVILPIEFHYKWSYYFIIAIGVSLILAFLFMNKLIKVYFRERIIN